MKIRGYEEVLGGVQRSLNGNVVTICGETYLRTEKPWHLHQEAWKAEIDERRKAFIKRHEGCHDSVPYLDN